MPSYKVRLLGAEAEPVTVETQTADQARDVAIVKLGTYLQEHPDYAYDGHWQVEVRNASDRVLMRVIVSTVVSPPAINWASFDR